MPEFPNIPVFVITVGSFVDRHRHIRKYEEKFGCDFHYILDFDAVDIDHGSLPWAVDRSLPLASQSNALKHIQAQKLLLQCSEGIGLVIEDDVIFVDNFVDRLRSCLLAAKNLSPGFLVFLGGEDNKVARSFFEAKSNDLIESPLTTAEAYLIDRAGCERRLKSLHNRTIDRQADHLIKLLDEELGIRHYRPASPLATQGSITGLFRTSLDGSRGSKWAWYLGARFRWNVFRNQTNPRGFMRLREFFRGGRKC